MNKLCVVFAAEIFRKGIAKAKLKKNKKFSSMHRSNAKKKTANPTSVAAIAKPEPNKN